MTSALSIDLDKGAASGDASRLRAATWALHVAVVVLAVFSVCFGRFDLWVDLRFLGRVWGGLVWVAEGVWVGTVLLVPWLVGPRTGRVGLGRESVWGWVNGGVSEGWGRRLLWGTWGMVAILAGNTVYFYWLMARGRIDAPWPVPITVPAGVLLAAWAIASRRWMRVGKEGGEAVAGPGRTAGRRWGAWGIAAAGAYVAGVLGLNAAFFGLQSYANPPRETVDLAVVMGNRVLPDGTASLTLRDRTLAAADLYKRGLARHLYLSGAVWPQPGGGTLSEPMAMLKVCLDSGVPGSAVTLDSHGVNTRATAYDAAAYMREHGFKTAAVCSDSYHLFRCAMSFRQEGVDAYTVASVRQDWACAAIYPVAREMAAVVVYEVDPSYRAPKETAMAQAAYSIVVRKTAGVLELYQAAGTERKLVKTYACITGGNSGDKAVEGDRKTPLGIFHVVYKNQHSNYHLSLGLDYPTAEDADRGLAAELITRAEYEGIIEALNSDLSLEENQKKLWYTKLGGEIFIHGHGTGRPATAGCVAVSDADIEEIFKVAQVGTEVEIWP